MKIKNMIVGLLGMTLAASLIPAAVLAGINDKAGKVDIAGHSVYMNDEIGVNFYLKVSDKAPVSATYDWGTGTSEHKDVAAYIAPLDDGEQKTHGGANYRASCVVPVSSMTDTITLNVRSGDTKILTDKYRVVDYAGSLAKRYSDVSDNHNKYIHRILESLLSYGSKTQQYLGYRTGDLADKKEYMAYIKADEGTNKRSEVISKFRKDAQTIIDTIEDDFTYASIRQIDENDEGVSFDNASLVITPKTGVRMSFNITDEKKAAALEAEYEDQKIDLINDGSKITMTVPVTDPRMITCEPMIIKVGRYCYQYAPIVNLASSVVKNYDTSDMCCALYAFSRFVDVFLNMNNDTAPDNGIPVVYLNIDEARGTIDDMIVSPDHSAYCYGSLSIDVPAGFHYSDFPDLKCESFDNLSMSIRGRGNSTWRRAQKKPFKIKLDKKADLFGLGSNKHWVLVANALDTSLLRDRITAWLGDKMDFGFTPRGVPVDVVMTGDGYGTKYLGSYYLSENVRVDTNRLEIEELDEDDTDLPTISGGYLLQNSSQVRVGSPDRFITDRGAEWATHTPSFDTEADGNFALNMSKKDQKKFEDTFADPELGDAYENPAQQKYIQNYIQEIEDVLFKGDTSYRKVFDVKTSAKYWLVNSVSYNTDGFGTGSTYIYKKRNNDTLYWGPLWDFDFAWDNNSSYTGVTAFHEWIKPMFCDRSEGGFVQEVLSQWKKMKGYLGELTADGGVIDKYYEETKRSAVADHLANYPDETDYSEKDYRAAVNKLKTWIINRAAWYDEHIDELKSLTHKVTLVTEKDSINVFGEKADMVYGTEINTDKKGFIFVGWEDEDGNTVELPQHITKDIVLTAKYIPEEEKTYGEDIVFRKDTEIARYNPNAHFFQIDYEVLPVTATDKTVKWKSSDEDIATVDDEGLVNFKCTGTVKLTAKLSNGVKKSVTLTVIDDTVPVPSSIAPDADEISMTAGETTHFMIITDPAPARIDEYKYVSSDKDVVTVDEYGVITAEGKGEATVTVKASFYDMDADETRTVEMEVKITVS